MPDIEKVPISKLKLLDNNPRKITKEQFEKLCKSLENDPDFLWNRPCLVNKEGDILTVYAGNQRIRAAKKLKWKEVPCIIDIDLPQEIINERVIKDNAHFGEFDHDLLSSLFEIDMLLDCGITLKEMHIDLPELADDDDQENEKKKKKSTCPSCGHEF